MMLAFRQTVPLLLALLVLTHAEDVVPESVVADPEQEQQAVPTAKQDSSYRVDCSFPIHNLDFQNGNSCGTLLGDRYSVYKDFMKGCREQFGHRCDDIEEDRIEQMLRQPPSLVNYTATGFKKIRAPAHLFALLENHWLLNNNNNEENYVEHWSKGHTYVNYWHVNTTYYGLMEPKVGGSEELQQKIFDLVKPIIEEWTGMELQPTSLYGIRVYHKGAILSPHVDRNPLISSAIINVAQDPDMTEDWPLEVYDREGKAVNISMVPGDMVLYESGTLVHGRPFPLQGKMYANVFIHFEPTGRKLQDIDNEEMHYNTEQNPANFLDDAMLPPYMIPDSPEAHKYVFDNPWGWEAPIDADGDMDEEDDDQDGDMSDSDDENSSDSDDEVLRDSDDEGLNDSDDEDENVSDDEDEDEEEMGEEDEDELEEQGQDPDLDEEEDTLDWADETSDSSQDDQKMEIQANKPENIADSSVVDEKDSNNSNGAENEGSGNEPTCPSNILDPALAPAECLSKTPHQNSPYATTA